jgi:hypothetical protein
LEECDTLESLRKWHWVDLFEEDGYVRLMRALRARADKIGVTLQVKKSWLPKVTTPHHIEKPVPVQKPVQEQLEHEAPDAHNREKIEKEFQRKRQQILSNAIKKLKWERFKNKLRFRLEMIRLYIIPILLGLTTIVLLFYAFALLQTSGEPDRVGT